MCGIHKDTKKIFCEESKTLLCLPCSETQEHGAHRHSSIESAMEECRIKKKKFKKASAVEEYLELIKQMTALTEKIQENERNLSEESNIINMRSALNITCCIQKHLREMYKELLNMCHKSDVEPLQDLGDILSRMKGRLNQFGVEISFYYEISSHGTMHSDFVKRLDFGYDVQDGCFSSARYNFADWGSQGITSGK
ncbi:PREDICTED: tripartite motif-containing protein 43-like [Elephantulus edwardii]|uniref:tripartite motif-containing protein 43-like n=1 Tax=Elephantulus edwardii TaxID=28737 RepID=UPI0003F0E33B|nr:PREDICTED: tripartite motif-containing protein 43-like [Elephantulus edwardii]